MPLINRPADVIERIGRELRSYRRMLADAGRATRGALLVETRAWAEDAAATCEAISASITAEFRRIQSLWYVDEPAADTPPTVNYYHHRVASAATIGAIALCLLEILFTGGTAYLFLVVEPWIAIAIGSVVALLIAFGLKGVVVPIAVAPTELTPLRGRKRIVGWLLFSGTIEAILLLFLLTVARSYYNGDEHVPLGLIMALLSVWTPIVAGLLFALASLYDWSTTLPRDFWDVHQLLGAIRDLRDVCQQEAERASEPRRTLTAVTSVVLFLMLAAGGWISETRAATLCDGEVWDDGTNSVLQSDRLQTKQMILNEIASSPSPCRSMHWQFFRFGSLSWIEQPKAEINVTHWSEPPCAERPASEMTKLFKPARDAAAKSAGRECRAQREASKRRHEESLQAELNRVRKTWAGDATILPDDCTALFDLAMRIASYRQAVYAVLVTDGIETCAKAPRRIAAPAAGSLLVVVLVGNKDVSAGSFASSYAERRAKLQALIPWARIVAPWEFRAELRRL